MKIINASLLPIGSNQRISIPVMELLIEATIDPVNKIIVKDEIPQLTAIEKLKKQTTPLKKS